MFFKRVLSLFKRRLDLRRLTRLATSTASLGLLNPTLWPATPRSRPLPFLLGPPVESSETGDFDFVRQSSSCHVLSIDPDTIDLLDLPLSRSIVLFER